MPDADHDGVPDACDNCIDTANPLQRDFDKDHIGDAYVPCGVRLRFDIECAMIVATERGAHRRAPVPSP